MTNSVQRPRVVITGTGAITPLGLTPEEFWQNLLSAKSGIGPVTLFDASKYRTQIAGEVKNFDPTQHGIEAKDARRMGRATLFVLAASRSALNEAGLGDSLAENFRAGVVVGTGLGGFVEAIKEHDVYTRQGTGRVSPFLAAVILPNMPAFYVAQHFRARGYNSTVVTTCAAGTDAIGTATEAIRRGVADIMLAGGTDAIISDIVFTAFGAMRALSTRNDNPAHACRPFDKNRDGLVIGEGSGMLVLENLEHALARGARIYAEIIGYAANSDAFHFVAPDPEAISTSQVMRDVLKDANVTVDQIDYINAHATSTQLNDPSETLAVKNVFGERAYQIPISATKSMVGHAMGAAGAFEAIACALTIRDQKIHPTANYEIPDPTCDLDYVPNVARNAKVDIAMSNSFGFGGQNASLILRKYV
ncbi:MAG: beta-ketoacyl-ACP synthase II [Chloroflexi bacterium]|nr:beta-ketoacyl-ACP synthase II [Chloroflexota bacterium]